MNILVLGGTRFFGLHIVKSLLRRGNEVTIATRGNKEDEFGSLVKRIHDRLSHMEKESVWQNVH